MTRPNPGWTSNSDKEEQLQSYQGEYVDGTKATASGENGVLTIMMPKKEEARAKVIKVQTK